MPHRGQHRLEQQKNANALERKGIQTERGNINREIVKRNIMLEQAKEMLEIAKQELHSAQYVKIKNEAVSVKNEVLEMIGRVQEKMGRLALPIVSAKYLAKIPNRDTVILKKELSDSSFHVIYCRMH